MDRHDPADLASALSAVAHQVEPEDDLTAILETLVRGARDALPDIDHAGISIAHRRGRIETLATTGPFVDQLDALQYELDEGPCVHAVRSGEPVVRVQDARHEERWPRFMPVAVSRGLRSQLGLRLYTGQRTIGVLNLYSTTSDTLTDEVVSMAELFAAYLTVAMGRAQTSDATDSLLVTRQLIGQATGVVMQRYTLSAGRAFEYLLRISSLSNVKLRDIAQEFVDSCEGAARERVALTHPPSHPGESLHTLTFLSTAVEPFGHDALAGLLHQARLRNRAWGLTGRMLYADGHFIQTLEGPGPAVDAMFALIEADPRHRDVLVALRETTEHRNFPDWSMGFDTATAEEAAALPGFTDYLDTGKVAPGDAQELGRPGVFHRVFRDRMR